jgi:cell division protease FtsH
MPSIFERSPERGGPPASPPPDDGRQRRLRIVIWLFVLLAFAPWLAQMAGFGEERGTTIEYSAFRDQVRRGNVERVVVKGKEIRGTLAQPAVRSGAPDEGGMAASYADFVTWLPSFGDEELLRLLEEKEVAVRTQPESDVSWWFVLLNLLPVVLLVWLAVVFLGRMRRQGQGLFSVGKSRAKLYERRDEATTFEDVAGADGAKAELREIIDFLADPVRLQRLGGKPPKGVLLLGSPGTGKTLLARATAGEAGVPFFSITGSDFMEMFVGVGASRVRDLFADARKAAPCIIFIDELDSIGRTRGAGLGGGHDEREQTLNQLLSEMDGFEPSIGVIVMAATNRADILDRALLRPGRFDRRISVELPGVEARRAILEIHARGKPLAEDVDLGDVARGTPGFSGAELENLLNEAALTAARGNAERVNWRHIDAARDKILLGLEREGLALTEEECRLLAFHEGGHAVVAAALPHADPLLKVTIVPRGRAMGVTQQLPKRDYYVLADEYLRERLAVMLGGRAAEQLVLGTTTTGAENDLKEAVRLARKMVLDWGMSPRLPNIALGGEREHVFLGQEIAHRREYSEATAREVDQAVREIVDQAFGRAIEVLTRHRRTLERVAEELIREEDIPGQRVVDFLREDIAAAAEAPRRRAGLG